MKDPVVKWTQADVDAAYNALDFDKPGFGLIDALNTAAASHFAPVEEQAKLAQALNDLDGAIQRPGNSYLYDYMEEIRQKGVVLLKAKLELKSIQEIIRKAAICKLKAASEDFRR